jgi:hypothetical protein
MKPINFLVIALLSAVISLQVHQAHGQDGTPLVFQAAGPTVESLEGTLDEFRAALGGDNNLNNPGPIATGRREINWDGGGAATTVSPTPFAGFQNIRGALFTVYHAGDGFRTGAAGRTGNHVQQHDVRDHL